MASGTISKIYDSGWKTATYASPFSNAGSNSDYAPHYRRYGNIVEIHGQATVSSAQTAAERTLFTLPSGYRPSSYNIIKYCQGSDSKAWVLSVKTDGTVTIQRYGNIGSNESIPSGAWLPFHAVFSVPSSL